MLIAKGCQVLYPAAAQASSDILKRTLTYRHLSYPSADPSTALCVGLGQLQETTMVAYPWFHAGIYCSSTLHFLLKMDPSILRLVSGRVLDKSIAQMLQESD